MDQTQIVWGQISLIVLLLAYIAISKRSKFLPAVPLTLIIIYLGLRLLANLTEGMTWGGALLNYINLAATISLSWAVARFVFWLIMEVPNQIRKTPLPKIILWKKRCNRYFQEVCHGYYLLGSTRHRPGIRI